MLVQLSEIFQHKQIIRCGKVDPNVRLEKHPKFSRAFGES